MTTLSEILNLVNDNTVVDIYSAETYDIIASYDGRDSIPEDYDDCIVTDIFVTDNKLCIEIEESDE